MEYQLCYQEIEFVIGYEEFCCFEFVCVLLFKDEMVLVVSCNYLCIFGLMMEVDIYCEEYVVVVFDWYVLFSLLWYDMVDK